MWTGNYKNKFENCVREYLHEEGVLDCDSCVCPRNGEIGGEERCLLGGIERAYRVCEDRGKVVIIGDMNARVGDSEVEGVVGKFGVSWVNEN